jgi:maltooligosyltrehalose synthase
LTGGPKLRCTYRLQLGPKLDLEHARALVPYLRELGVSHDYLSPSFQAREGPTHGYDVIDPTKISDMLQEGIGNQSDLHAKDSGNYLKWATAGVAKAGVGLGRVAVGTDN